MTDFVINDHILTKECDELAQDIFDEVVAEITSGIADGESPADFRDCMSDRAHETADGHEWVIYTYKAHMLCAHCNVDQGEEFLEDVGMPDTPTYDSLGTMIAYGEMRARIDAELADLIDEWETDQ